MSTATQSYFTSPNQPNFPILTHHTHPPQSEVEETLERVKGIEGIEGYVICNRDGTVLRRFPSMPQELAEAYSQSMMELGRKGRNVVRDLDPKNELRYLRIRAKRHEVLVAFDVEFLVIIIQRWTASSS
tara:strand:+ start:599 stop:985 length:387 start_codon:yes stop_codon:yes gene_type:complete